MFNGTLFQQSLQDLVKGIRAHRRDEGAFIRDKLAEIANECRSKDLGVKTNAVLKLTHLQMMGCNMSFASFYIVEVMCSSDFSSKRIGYLAAAQSFSPTTDVLLLTTNQFKKDLTNGRMQDCSQALTCLAKIATESLACDLNPDVTMLLSSPRPYVRKKTLLVLFRFITVYPETLAMISDKFRKCLEDPDPGVVCAAVTVTCELARTSPRDFLGLAPALYGLLTTSSNNWMLIKIVKLMGVLTPLEPRLGKKLLGPLTNLMRTTRAKSLLYECCCTVTLGLMEHQEAVNLCGERLSEFMVDPDQNLKYLGLLSMRRLAKAHPNVAMQHRDLILDCLDDEDIGIRLRALELVSEFVTRRTLRDISRILLRKLYAANTPAAVSVSPVVPLDAENDFGVSEAAENDASAATLLLDPETPYRDALAEQLLVSGTFIPGEGYPILSSGDDFVWYIATVLGGLARTPGLSRHVSEAVASQLTELISRVEAVRTATMAVAASLMGSYLPAKRPRSSVPFDLSNDVSAASEVEESLGRGAIEEPAASESPQNPDSAILGRNNVEQAENVERERSSVRPPRRMASSEVAAEATSASEMPNVLNGDGVECGDVVSSSSDENVPPLSSSVVAAAAWVLGEHGDLLKNPFSVMNILIDYPTENLSCSAQVAILGSLTKLFALCPSKEAQSMLQPVLLRMENSLSSDLAEVYERASLYKTLIEVTGHSELGELRAVFEGKLLPVDSGTEADVPVPDGLDLDSPLLDTDGADLYTFLTGGKSYMEGDLEETMSGRIVDNDELFQQLKEQDNIFGGSSSSPVMGMVAGAPHGRVSESSPFYLGVGDEAMNESAVGASKQELASDGDFHRIGEENTTGLFSGDDTPVNVLFDRHTGGVGKDGRNASMKKVAVPPDHVSGKFGTAFEGLFGGPSADSVPNDGSTTKKKKKKKKKKAGSKGKEQDGGLVPGNSNRDASSAGNLIDFDTSVDDGGSRQAGHPAKMPAHIGQSEDLLL